jgi:two-component system response regulator LytT
MWFAYLLNMGSGRLNIVVVEDEAIIADHIISTLIVLGFRPWGPAVTVSEALGYVRRGPVDLVLIDINLHGEHAGIELGHQLKMNHRVPHVFLTANTDEATVREAKYTTPMGFVVKPFQKADLYSSIEVAMSNWQLLQSAVGDPVGTHSKQSFTFQQQGRVLFVPIDGVHCRVFVDEILFVESAHVYVNLHMRNGQTYVVRAALSALEQALPQDRFIRIHRGYLANVSFVERFDGKNILLGEHLLPVSKSCKNEVQARLPTLSKFT